MARNIEIKARIADFDAVVARVIALADHGPIEISQDDTFFAYDAGRLKLRMFSSGEGELIEAAYVDLIHGGPCVP